MFYSLFLIFKKMLQKQQLSCLSFFLTCYLDTDRENIDKTLLEQLCGFLSHLLCHESVRRQFA